MIPLLAALVLSGICAQAQTITETFGSGANQFSIDFVEIGNPGNAADTTGSPNLAGRVDYIYNLGKYEISRYQVEMANSGGSLGITYVGNYLTSPAAGINWLEAARFVNYLNTSKGYQAAYSFDVNGNFQLWAAGQYNGNNMFRHKDAVFVLPSTDEWYKGAYGSPDGSWYNYPTGSDSAPVATSGGTLPGTSVFARSFYADFNNAGGLSPYGTMAQGGNVWEVMETAYDGINDSPAEFREMRGGEMDDLNSNNQLSSRRVQIDVSAGSLFVRGFRVAMVPEPSSLSLLLAGGAVLMAGRRRA